ncbi:MAG: MAC/perforin domain-containing protein [Pseudomonadota bacterium]
MPKDISLSVVEPMRPQGKTASDILPGTDVIGYSMSVRGEYCSARSLKKRVIDLGALTKDAGNGRRTSELVDIQKSPEGMAREFNASSFHQLATDFSGKVSLKGNYSFFSGELDVAFDKSTSSRVSTQYAQYNEQIYLKKLNLPGISALRRNLLPDVKEDFESTAIDPEKLIEYYGTHYISSVITGARVSYSCAIDHSEVESKVKLSLAAKLSYENRIGKAELDVDTELGKAAKNINDKALCVARVLGGDPTYVSNILNGSYDAWHASIADNQHVVDLYGGMHRLSDLIEDKARADAVEAAIIKVLQREKWPDDPDLVRVQPYLSSDKKRWYFSATNDEPPEGFGPYPKTNATFYAYNKKRDGSSPIYRFSAGTGDTLRFMLSANSENRHGWTAEKEPAFYAYVNGGGDRVPMYAYHHVSEAGTRGWYYSTDPNESDKWKQDPSNNFFAPAV